MQVCHYLEAVVVNPQHEAKKALNASEKEKINPSKRWQGHKEGPNEEFSTFSEKPSTVVTSDA